MKTLIFSIVLFFVVFNNPIKSQLIQMKNNFLAGVHAISFNQIAKNPINNAVMLCNNGGLFITYDYGNNWENCSKNINKITRIAKNVVFVNNTFITLLQTFPFFKSILYKYTGNNDWEEINTLPSNKYLYNTIGTLNNNLVVLFNKNDSTFISFTSDLTNWSSPILIYPYFPYGELLFINFTNNVLFLYINNLLLYTSNLVTFDTVTTNGLTTNYLESWNLKGDTLGNIYYKDDQTPTNIYKYDFNTKQWINITPPNNLENYMLVDIEAVANKLILYYINFLQNDIKFMISEDGGNTFSYLNINLFPPVLFYPYHIQGDKYIALDLSYNLIYSFDGMNTWNYPQTPIYTVSTANLINVNNNLFFNKSNVGIVKFDIINNNWNYANSNLPSLLGYVYFIYQLNSSINSIYCINYNFFENQFYIFRSNDLGGSWNNINFPFTGNISWPQFSGNIKNKIFLSGYDNLNNNFKLYAFNEETNTWEEFNTNPSLTGRTFIFNKGQYTLLFEETEPYNYFKNGYLYNQQNQTVQEIFYSNSITLDYIRIKRNIFSFDDWWNLDNAIIDIDTINNYFITVLLDYSNEKHILVKYDLNNNTFTQITPIGLPENFNPTYIINYSSNAWLLATTQGIYRSTDGGNNWNIFYNQDEWLDGMIVNKLIPINNDLYLGTLANSLWKIENFTSSESLSLKNNLIIIPNPVKDWLTIYLNEPINEIKIYNTMGAIVYIQKIDNYKNILNINIENLTPGIYYIQANTLNKNYKEKFIKY